MRFAKKCLSGILCLIFLLGLLPTVALAAGGTLSDETAVDSEEPITRAQLAEMIYVNEKLQKTIDLMGVGNPDPNFTDVNNDTCTSVQQEAIKALYRARAISGTGPNTFSPSGTVTRGEAVVVIWRAAGSRSNIVPMDSDLFNDPNDPLEPWYAPAVNCFYGAGMLSGTSTGGFGGSTEIPVKDVNSFLTAYNMKYDTFIANTVAGATTRAEMTVEFYEKFYPELSKIKPTRECIFTDLDGCTPQQIEAIQFFYEREIVDGTGGTEFMPHAPVSNFQLAALLRNCATAAVPAPTEGIALFSAAAPLAGGAPQNPFDFLAGQGLNVDTQKANPNAPGLTDTLTTWNTGLTPMEPTISPVSGTYAPGQEVTITAVDGASIYYTTDGTEPTTSSPQYIEAITVNETATIKAIAVKNNLISPVAEATYTIIDPDKTLAGLTLSDGVNDIALTPAFHANTINYTATVGSDVAGVTVTPSAAADSSATITVNGEPATSGMASQTLLLTAGENTITVVVTSSGDETTTYTITITKTNIHTITFDATGGSVTPANAVTTSEGRLSSLPTPVRSDYRFEGWYTMSTGGNLVTTDTVFNNDCRIYAHWTYIGGSSAGGSTGGGNSSGSSSNGVSGSGDNVSVSASGGSVTASQMTSAVNKADEGAAITVKASGSSAVTLPVGGMASAADNNSDVVVDLRSGEVILSAQAIVGMTDGVSASGKVEVSVTSQTGSGDDAISNLLDKGAAVFDVSVKVGDKIVHSFDGSLTLTFTVSNLSRIADPHVLHILTNGTREYYVPDRISGNTVTIRGIRNLSTFAVIPGSEVPKEPANPFDDINASDYYYDAVLWAVENGVTNGISATAYGPGVAMTRGQIVTLLWRAYGAPRATGTNPFTDVSASDYYYDAVLWAVANGITVGTSATTFGPEMEVTRAQAVTFQWRAAGFPVVYGNNFDDVPADIYYANAVAWAVSTGITSGTGNNTFSPDMVVTRAQAVTFLYRELAE